MREQDHTNACTTRPVFSASNAGVALADRRTSLLERLIRRSTTPNGLDREALKNAWRKP